MTAMAESKPKTRHKTIITCAVTGSIHTPSMSPHLPVTPDEIARESIAAAEAGASIIHLHARDSAAPGAADRSARDGGLGVRHRAVSLSLPQLARARCRHCQWR